jgi:hypothetical protein
MFEVGSRLGLIAGPCVIESEEHVHFMAHAIKAMVGDFVFKASFDKANRTSLKGFRGPGMKEGLKILRDLRTETGIPILTDIHEPSQAGPAADAVDILQIPAFLCRQTDLLLEGADGQDGEYQEGPIHGARRYPPRGGEGGFDGQHQDHPDRARIFLWLQQPGGRYARAEDYGGERVSGGLRRDA